MGNPFEQEIAAAQLRRKRTRIITVCTSVGLLALVAIGYIYTFAVRFEVALLDFPSQVRITVVSGNAVDLGLSRVFLLSGRASIEISAPGYKTASVWLETGRDAAKVVAIALDYSDVGVRMMVKQELTSPAWYVDGILVSSEGELRIELRPGEHLIELVSDHHERAALTTVVPPAVDLVRELELSPRLVGYQIETVPSGGEVFIDGMSIGTSPVRGDLPSATIRIQTAMPGFEGVDERVDLSELGGELQRRYQLRRASHQVSLSVSPLGGRLFVGGIERPVTDHLVVASVGEITAQYSKQGYESQVKTVANDEHELSFKLKKVFGEVTLESEPPSTALIDGVSFGLTPIATRLQAKNQTITFQRPGFVAKKVSFELTVGQSKLIRVKLQSLSDFHLAQSKPRIIGKAGISFKRFFPQPFTMGAPRNQKGQRANEIQRPVDFSRAFYMSEYEITEQQFGLFDSSRKHSNLPVTNVSWTNAALFCNWLSAEEGLQPFYQTDRGDVTGYDEKSRGYRLPTEAEWEYVARFEGKQAPTIFVWGNDYDIPDSSGNLADESSKGVVQVFVDSYKDGHDRVAVVGSFKSEPSGVSDMSGNVSEWVHDLYSLELTTSGETYVDYMGGDRGSQHIVKGSNYASAIWTELRASFKESVDGPRSDVGFRVARYIN